MERTDTSCCWRGGTVAAVFKFIEFLITHKTQRKDRKEDKEENNIRDEMHEYIDNANSEWKVKYCDKNFESINELADITVELKNNVVLLTNNISQMQEYNCHVGDAVKGIIHDRLIHNVDTYIERGGITREERTTLASMYQPYTSLGGNGDVQTAYTIAMDLPIYTKEEAIEKDKLKKSK